MNQHFFEHGLYDGYYILNEQQTINTTASVSSNGDAVYLVFYDQEIVFERSTKYYWKKVARISDRREISGEVFNLITAVINSPAKNEKNVVSENLAVSLNESTDNDGETDSSIYSLIPLQKPGKFMEMDKLQGKTFPMGQPNPDIGYADFFNDKQPVQERTIDDFIIGKYEVTWAQFRDFLNAVKIQSASAM
ncbi:SUMF1/EgtB/PvdO family nonheme iron enzyme [Maribellus comscasis]|nr:SUMF1/EgtB/PvdO family nonheme iron enzyme [Maribellus comscasis]